MSNKCKTCHFIYKNNEKDVGGECRRFPPQINTYSNANGDVDWVSDFPWVNDESYCGEFRKPECTCTYVHDPRKDCPVHGKEN